MHCVRRVIPVGMGGGGGEEAPGRGTGWEPAAIGLSLVSESRAGGRMDTVLD